MRMPEAEIGDMQGCGGWVLPAAVASRDVSRLLVVAARELACAAWVPVHDITSHER